MEKEREEQTASPPGLPSALRTSDESARAGCATNASSSAQRAKRRATWRMVGYERFDPTETKKIPEKLARGMQKCMTDVLQLLFVIHFVVIGRSLAALFKSI